MLYRQKVEVAAIVVGLKPNGLEACESRAVEEIFGSDVFVELVWAYPAAINGAVRFASICRTGQDESAARFEME